MIKYYTGKCILVMIAIAMFICIVMPSEIRAESIKIVRDEYGIPHIYAVSEEGLFYGQGYAMAEDRLFQMEMCRIAAQGKLSEVFGERYIEYDKLSRRDLYSDTEVQKMMLTLPDNQKRMFIAFSSGINQYIKEALDNPDKKLPFEFDKLNIKPVPWKGEDVIRVFISSFFRYFDSDQELKNAALFKYAIDKYGEVDGKNVFNDVVWANDPAAPVTASLWGTIKKEKALNNGTYVSGNTEGVYRSYEKEKILVRNTLKEIGVPYKGGSYALAISGKKTSTGNPMLLSGPQVGFGLPSNLYECGMHAKDIDCYGFTYVGVPGFLVGQNKDIGWAVTVGEDNQEDFFVEKLNPKNPNQYWYKGKWVDMEKESFLIKVKGKNDEFYDVKKTVHGPVISWDAKDTLNLVAYTKSWSYKSNALDNWNSMYNVTKARNSDEFFNAVRTASFSLNCLCVDRKGDICYMHCGKYPIRSSEVDTRLPTDGSGKFDWTGFVNASDLPQGKNPPQGYYVNWNTKPAPTWNNGERTLLWGIQNKVNLFFNALKAPDMKEITFQDVKEMDYIASSTNIYAPDIKPILLNAISTNDEPDIKEADQCLRYWNNRYEDKDNDGFYDSPGALLFDTWWEIVTKDIFYDDLGEYYTMAWNDFGASLVLRVLSKDMQGIALNHDYLNGKSPATVMTDSLKKAVIILRERNGKDSSRWLKRVVNERLEAKFVGIGGISIGKSDTLVIPSVNRGTAVMIMEASKNWIKGVSATYLGASGFIGKDLKPSEHFKDQMNLYINRKYKDMLFYPEDIQHHTETIKNLDIK